MDANSSLYMQAGNCYTQKQLNCMVGKAADSFAAHSSSCATHRSKAMVHLVGPGVHFTHPPAVSIYSSVKQLVRLLAKQEFTKDQYAALWHRKYRCRASLFKSVTFALRFLTIEWNAPYSFKLGSNSFNFDLETYSKKECNKLWHDLRDFLRLAVARKESKRRPKDFAGLEDGWDTRREVRANTHSLWHRRSGPALLCSAIWTRAKIYKVNRSWTDNPVCARCGKKVETRWHRLFACVLNSDIWEHHLEPLGITLEMIKKLPTVTKRCGIFVKGSLWTQERACALQDYMVAVNASATTAYDAFRKGNDVSELKVDVSGKASAASPDIIYKLALPPLKRKKVRQTQEDKDEYLKSSTWSTLPKRMMFRQPLPDGRTWIYTDGSFTPAKDNNGELTLPDAEIRAVLPWNRFF